MTGLKTRLQLKDGMQGLILVRQIAIDETWSALRFRDASLVKTRK